MGLGLWPRLALARASAASTRDSGQGPGGFQCKALGEVLQGSGAKGSGADVTVKFRKVLV